MQTETNLLRTTRRTLADYTSTALIVPQLHSRATAAVMQELNDVLHRVEAIVSDHLFPGLAALNRELLTSMDLDFGAAFPQLLVPSLQRPRFVVGRATEPLPWRASFYPPIEFVFLVVEPSRTDLEYKQLMAALHRLGNDRLRLDDLRRAHSGEEMLAVLAQCPISELEKTISRRSAAR
jgi:mannitol/fructose-specific phosphotransferase system IIA component (Ntr-type)